MFLLLALLHSLPSFASSDPAWLALLHFNGSKSSAAGESPLFLSKDGHKNPEAELEATKKYFDEWPEEAACRFPARAIYLNRRFEGPSELCERWKKWRQAISAKGAELVFAAAFISSPSSMYGHTLMKFVRSGASEGEDLLDYTLNYGANTGSTVGIPYVWRGLTGGFNGNYATAPFYLKVREYNFVENRDFWIYPLKLTPQQLELLVAHAWELRNVDFPYFFLHRNCSFYVLELLEVVKPGSNLTSHFPFWTVPMDTIRLLANEGWLEKPRFRPSRYRRLKLFRDELESGEASEVEALADTGRGILQKGREALELDAAYELWRYRTEGKKQTDSNVEMKLLKARSAFKPQFQPDFSQERAPEEGTPSSRVYLAGGKNRAHDFLEFSYRGKLHDLLSDPLGYEDYSELTMGDIRARVEDGKFFLERFDVLRLRSIAPREKWIPRMSWSFRGGFARAKEFPGCEDWNCSEGNLEGGLGTSMRVGPLLVFGLGEAGFELGKPFDRGYRLGVGPTGGIFAPLWAGARAIVEGTWRFRLLGSDREKRQAQFGFSQSLTKKWELRFTGETAYGYREGMAQAHFFF